MLLWQGRGRRQEWGPSTCFPEQDSGIFSQRASTHKDLHGLLSFYKISTIKDALSNGDEKVEWPCLPASCAPSPQDALLFFWNKKERVLFVGASFLFFFFTLNDVVGSGGSMFLFYVIFYPLLLWGGRRCLSLGCGCWGRSSLGEE